MSCESCGGTGRKNAAASPPKTEKKKIINVEQLVSGGFKDDLMMMNAAIEEADGANRIECGCGVKVERARPIVPKRAFREHPKRFCDATTYKKAYPGHYDPKKLENYSPKARKTHGSGIGELMSTYQTDFVNSITPCPTVVAAIKKGYFKRLPFRMDGQSSYQSDYKPKFAVPKESYRPIIRPRTDYKLFDDRTTYNTMYVATCLPCTKLAKPAEQIRMNCDDSRPFRGISIYRKDFVPKAVIPAKAIKDCNIFRKASGKIEEKSVYRTDYCSFHFDDCQCGSGPFYDPKGKDMCDFNLIDPYPEIERKVNTILPAPPCKCPNPHDRLRDTICERTPCPIKVTARKCDELYEINTKPNPAFKAPAPVYLNKVN